MRRGANGTKTVLLILAALAVLAIVAGFVWQKLFVVRNVVIEGGEEISRDEVVRASGLAFGEHITRVNADGLRTKLEATGIYALDGVEVRYPNTVVFSVRKRTRDAVIIDGGQYLVLDSDGHVIEVSSSMPEKSGVYVYGLNATTFRIGGKVTAPEDRLAAMKTVLDAVRLQGAGEYISDLDVSDTDQMWITTRTGIRVKLGGGDRMADKILWLRSAVADLESRGQIRGTLDVSSGTKADYMP